MLPLFAIRVTCMYVYSRKGFPHISSWANTSMWTVGAIMFRTLVAYRRILAVGFLINMLMLRWNNFALDETNTEHRKQLNYAAVDIDDNMKKIASFSTNQYALHNRDILIANQMSGSSERKWRSRSNHIRSYMNPIEALLQQDTWNAEFVAEIKRYYTKDIQGPTVVRIPKVTGYQNSNQGNQFDTDPSSTLLADSLYEKPPHPNIDCSKVFNNDLAEYIKAETTKDNIFSKNVTSDFTVYNATEHCEEYKKMRGYIEYITPDEENFPIAFSILVYENIALLERLLRAIYRPNNLYCIHVDRKSPRTAYFAARSLADCFNNVIMASQSVSVEWGRYGVLEADLVCMRDLWEMDKRRKKKDWKYFINLTGHEFPLKTNWEMVQILKAYGGAVDMGATTSSAWSFRIKCFYYWHLKNKTCLEPKLPLPYNFTYSKGPVHVALPREAAQFVLFSPISQTLLKWLNGTIVPDESFFATLFYSPQLGVPGAHKGVRNRRKRAFHPLVRYKKWTWWRPCRGRAVRHICLATLWDLPELKVRPELFVNKFEGRYHRLAYTCLEELHRNKTLEEIRVWRLGLKMEFDTRAYGALPWFKNRV